MKLWSTVPLLIVLANGSLASELEPANVGGLANECRRIERFDSGNLSARDADRLMMCLGYFMGVSEMSSALNSDMYCIPSGVSTGQRAKIFVKWADEHPELHHLNRVYGVQLALAQAFPCK